MLKHVETLNGEILKPETPCWENKKRVGGPRQQWLLYTSRTPGMYLCFWQVVALLATWRAGGTCVPMDLKLPRQRQVRWLRIWKVPFGRSTVLPRSSWSSNFTLNCAWIFMTGSWFHTMLKFLNRFHSCHVLTQTKLDSSFQRCSFSIFQRSLESQRSQKIPKFSMGYAMQPGAHPAGCWGRPRGCHGAMLEMIGNR